MARMGHASVRTALIYRHPTSERDKKIADGKGMRHILPDCLFSELRTQIRMTL
jgi:hypothetical protein